MFMAEAIKTDQQRQTKCASLRSQASDAEMVHPLSPQNYTEAKSC